MIQLLIHIIGYSAVVGVDSTHFEEVNRQPQWCRADIPGFSWLRCRCLGCSGGVGSASFSGLEVKPRRTKPHCFGFANRHSGQVKAAMIPLSAGASKTGRIGTKSIKKHQKADKCSNTNFKPTTIH